MLHNIYIHPRQQQVGRYLTGVSVLLILWFSIRTVKYFIFWQPDAIRYLWYLFYLPMLFVPMLALLVALSLGQPDDYRLPKGPPCAVAHFRRNAPAGADQRPAPAGVYLSEGRRRVVGH